MVVFWTLLVGAALPYLWGVIANVLRVRQFGTFDNHNPRAQSAQLTGAGARAYAAHNNAWEALAVFAPAAVLVLVTVPTSAFARTFALVWLALRVLHGVTYIANLAPVRSLAFFGALAAALGMYLVAGGII